MFPFPSSASSPSSTTPPAPLVQLLPWDVNPATCKAAKPGWLTPGLVGSLACRDSALSYSGDTIFAYQMNSSANYQKSWANFNKFSDFNPNASSVCPPSGSATVGTGPWHDSYFPRAHGQILECGLSTNSKNQRVPEYAWSFPTEDAYIIAIDIGSPTTTYSTLDSWWRYNSRQEASPKPVTP